LQRDREGEEHNTTQQGWEKWHEMKKPNINITYYSKMNETIVVPVTKSY
jgi:hypothetical protein